MTGRSLPISEARRLLPQIVTRIAREGGRMDITRRGRPAVSIIRTRDLERPVRGPLMVADAARVELLIPPKALLNAVRALRSRTGAPRKLPTRG